MPVACYLRVSTEEQRERQSIDTQREFGQRYCELHQLPVYEVYADDGISGTVPIESRPGGRSILEAARKGRFDQLLVYKLDRLGREIRLILNAVAELGGYGVRVRSMTEKFDTGTATSRLMLTLLSGFASHEREVIRERCLAGTNRVAEAGAWLGGTVPFGYRKVGEKRDAHLVISEAPIPDLAMSEAEVIREVFHMAVVERKSCRAIADRLNHLRVPCAYVRDDRLTVRGKRRQKTSGVWCPGRVRGLITNKTYMGIHEFGKRSATKRPVVSREVPAIVDAEVWRKAQANLHAHLLFGKRSTRNQYLLRGLIKCGLGKTIRNPLLYRRERPSSRIHRWRPDSCHNGPEALQWPNEIQTRSTRTTGRCSAHGGASLNSHPCAVALCWHREQPCGAHLASYLMK
jgi:site-specific DNA recombinase